MTESTFTFRVDEDLKHQFAEIAKSKDRTGAQLLRDFMRETIAKQQEEAEYDAWFRAKVGRAIASADAGNLIPQEEVEREFAEWRAAALREIEEEV